MRIEKLIKIFVKMLPIYELAVTENWSYTKLIENCIDYGLCDKAKYSFGVKISSTMARHYEHYVVFYGYLFLTCHEIHKKRIQRCILPRRDFLKGEIKRLKKLQKQGFTHI